MRAPSGSAIQRGAIAWLPTLQAKGRNALAAQHLRWREPKGRPSTLHLLLLDTSGSMRQGGRLARAKGYAANVLEQVARAGDHVALLCFGGQGVEVLVPPGPARRAAAVRVQQRGGGGGTPLAQAMAAADNLMAQHRRVRSTSVSTASTVLWLLTDGRTLEQPQAPRGAEQLVVVDFDDANVRVGRCADWAEHWRAEYRRCG
ncbi:VWA domain-containing protein [Rhodoferax sp. TBRC 17660]|uniref:VWA domain-containing protein n=1 Tax=Rhodoferax potami TaxID=3068338 RepID=A0ABU3KI94_9BURK|nr:VWA domain-containing protein [Rhodoferax sp. TBRC 17660]MDT7517313.1 VWA domain-containing protein [Rhodoferax sp. TBRC 17660]